MIRPEHESDVLLRLFIQNTHNNLEAKVMEAIRPSIKQAVADAVAQLEPQVRQHYDMARNNMTFAITLKEAK